MPIVSEATTGRVGVHAGGISSGPPSHLQHDNLQPGASAKPETRPAGYQASNGREGMALARGCSPLSKESGTWFARWQICLGPADPLAPASTSGGGYERPQRKRSGAGERHGEGKQIEPLPLLRPPARRKATFGMASTARAPCRRSSPVNDRAAAEGSIRSCKSYRRRFGLQAAAFACKRLLQGVTRPGFSLAGLNHQVARSRNHPRVQRAQPARPKSIALRTTSGAAGTSARSTSPAAKPQPSPPSSCWGRGLTRSASSFCAAPPICSTMRHQQARSSSWANVSAARRAKDCRRKCLAGSGGGAGRK